MTYETGIATRLPASLRGPKMSQVQCISADLRVNYGQLLEDLEELEELGMEFSKIYTHGFNPV